MIRINIYRRRAIGEATLGTMTVSSDDGRILFECGTLEPKIRDVKVMGKTAIPTGTYKVKWLPSSKFNKIMPYLENVPNFSGIMIHVGNEVKDTQGCILVGTWRNDKVAFVYNSKLTFNLLEAIIRHEETTVHIYNVIRE